MNFINMTPHPVVIRKKDGSEITIEPSGQVFRLDEEDERLHDIDGIELVYRKFKLPDSIPPEFSDPQVVVIVSLPALMALKATGVSFDALIVAPDTGSGAIRDSQGRIVGTTRLITM
ncbi:MAG: hypothetical protein RMK89_11735 [Armatimonadota bacterium]|nr:hypothetical protein [Armatimonadota bacterium]MDW8144119.1 hypothetical protein [Armatimonadota bacterium]